MENTSTYLRAFCADSPAETRCKNVVLMSMRHDDVASTSIRRHFGTICPLHRYILFSVVVFIKGVGGQLF